MSITGSGNTHENNDYVFERAVRLKHLDGNTSIGRIDFYRRGSFVLEAKQSRWKDQSKEVLVPVIQSASPSFVEPEALGRRDANRGWDVLMRNARDQAEQYARALEPDHGWPPFLIVCDVGHCLELYADFSGQGKNYRQFPDRAGFRIYLDDLKEKQIRERLRAVWIDPHSLDPAKRAAVPPQRYRPDCGRARRPARRAVDIASRYAQGPKAAPRIEATLAALARLGACLGGAGWVSFTAGGLVILSTKKPAP